MTLDHTSDRLLRAGEVAKLMSLSRNAVYGMAERGEIPCLRISSRTVRFRERDLAQFLDGLSAK